MTKATASITTLVFDWDGTLADSAGLGLIAFQEAFAELEVAFSLEIYEAAYSPNWYATRVLTDTEMGRHGDTGTRHSRAESLAGIMRQVPSPCRRVRYRRYRRWF